MAPASNADHLALIEIIREFRVAATELASLRAEITPLRSVLDSLSRIVRGGNGDSSIMTQIALLEQQTELQTRMLEEVRKDVQKIKDDDRAGYRTIIVALIAASASLVGTIVTLIMHAVR